MITSVLTAVINPCLLSCSPSSCWIMSLTPDPTDPFLDPLDSLLRQSPLLGYEQAHFPSSSCCSVIPVTGPHLQGDVLSEEPTQSEKRKQVLQRNKLHRNKIPRQPRKVRSKLTGLAAPLHIDLRRLHRGISHPSKLRNLTLKGKTKQRHVGLTPHVSPSFGFVEPGPSWHQVHTCRLSQNFELIPFPPRADLLYMSKMNLYRRVVLHRLATVTVTYVLL